MAKKNFGNVVQESVEVPVMERRASRQAPVAKKQPKFKIALNDDNASKRTFFVRDDIGQLFDRAAFEGNIDKGALLNVALKEWLEKNDGRTEFNAI